MNYIIILLHVYLWLIITNSFNYQNISKSYHFCIEKQTKIIKFSIDFYYRFFLLLLVLFTKIDKLVTGIEKDNKNCLFHKQIFHLIPQYTHTHIEWQFSQHLYLKNKQKNNNHSNIEKFSKSSSNGWMDGWIDINK